MGDKTWEPSEAQERIVEKYGHLLNNTGGNEPLELLRRLNTEERLMTTNMPVAVLAIAVQSQISLLITLERESVIHG
ncbi:hypothetical protein HOT31_gp130 [Microbacterium phage Hendrix]|uniref:Uncharacterized protein n=1 Tax=Microbacterium phage Hendrix TaxID=2182341 RepID=A0A2U8UUG2_9CAUD|nr:hypothetical protein HOT31_gp130 [Microbacterium phage Hendrix]AWN07800.1 hypothetical protein PBI_HENDRIX_129 [Microbacterium phage Hendrix]